MNPVTEQTSVVTVDGIGVFRYRRRTMRTAVAINAEYNRLTEGAQAVSGEFAGLCDFLAYLTVMIVEAPDGWDPYAVDPDSEEEVGRLNRVYRAIKDAEARFRAGTGSERPSQGKGAE